VDAQKSLTEDVGLWLLAGAAIIAVTGYYGWYFTFQQGPSTAELWIFDGVEPGQVQKLALSKGNDGTMEWVLERSGGTWSLSKPSDVRLDPASAQRLVKSLVNLSPSLRFKGKPGETYGTQSNGAALVVSSGDREQRIFFGGSQPSGNGRYLVYGRDNRTVFAVNQRDYDALRQSLFDLRQKTLFEHSPGDVRQLTVEANGEAISYTRNNGEWSVNGTTIGDTGTEAVEDGLQTLMFMSADQFYDTQPEKLGTPRGSIRLDLGDETVEVTLGESQKGRRMLRKEGWPVVATRQDPASVFRDLPRLPDGWPEPANGSSGTNRSPMSGVEGLPGAGNRGTR
jgi:hypothetical protein